MTTIDVWAHSARRRVHQRSISPLGDHNERFARKRSSNAKEQNQMIGTLRQRTRDERGFTLVELLVVVTILGILAAVVTSSLIGLTGTAKTNACSEELRTVQVGMDAMMATQNITAVTAQAAPTITFTALPVGTGTVVLSPTYLRQANTKGSYTWTAAGLVSPGATLGTCL
jgi:prepilin-type N-terminal cleavage/methylation domain-containing protein